MGQRQVDFSEFKVSLQSKFQGSPVLKEQQQSKGNQTFSNPSPRCKQHRPVFPHSSKVVTMTQQSHPFQWGSLETHKLLYKHVATGERDNLTTPTLNS